MSVVPRRLDVSRLEPPEPMVQALAALRELGADEYLVIAHRREPVPLYDLLPGLGFRHRVQQGAATAFEIVIWRQAGPEPEAGP